ncbi:putative metal-binding motif-containing protein [Corallococcus macrosporus]|uniref:putative metal-binding motif-containing protein n=1 Tax=Corallococcus macrosporus TaxID=35 RepID=UPI00324230D2
MSVTYGSFKPACLRVEAKDATGHSERTDILSSQFKNADKREVLVAVRRKADWDTALNVTVSSYAAASGNSCSGEAVETFPSNSLTVVPKEFTRFDVTLQAVDGDGDGSPTGIEWAGISDCDDKRADVRPGADEKCDTEVDFDCDGKKACADSKCAQKTCTDGDLCNTGKRCIGVGAAAECGGGEPKCKQTGGQCQSAVRCEAFTGQCIDEIVLEGTACDPGDKCVTNGRCTADKRCVGDVKPCNTPLDAQCQESVGTCNSTNGLCEYAPKPVTTSCVDGNVCNDPGSCNGSGVCIGTPTPCPPRECHAVAGCTRNASCVYAGDPAQVNNPCSEDNSGTPRVCKVDGQCVAFPYSPSNFDPNDIPGGQIGELKTTGAVVFDTDARTWTPANLGPDTDAFTIRALPQAGGPEILLIPVRTLALGGELRIVGSRAVILAVYGNATLSHDILASGRIVNGELVPGSGGNQQCGTSTGKNGKFGGGEGGGGGGAGGATVGAVGGKGYDDGATRGDAGAQQASVITPLLGGCAGGNGGGTGDAAGGLGGAGGGALQLSVARTLTISKTLSVSGGGGLGGKVSTSPAQAAGGGGGGSGGRIVLEAFQVSLTADASLTANGGGGGQGAGQSVGFANNGADGANGSETTSTTASGGTGGSTLGGTGGAGGALDIPTAGGAGSTVPVAGGGGGGGGGGGAAGFIYLRSMRPCMVNTTVVSPTPTGGCTPL